MDARLHADDGFLYAIHLVPDCRDDLLPVHLQRRVQIHGLLSRRRRPEHPVQLLALRAIALVEIPLDHLSGAVPREAMISGWSSKASEAELKGVEGGD